MGRLEAGRTGATTKTALALAKALGVSAVWLAYGGAQGVWDDTMEARAAGWGARLAKARADKGMSTRELATQLAFSPEAGNVTQLEQEMRQLDLALAERIAMVLGVEAVWLAFGD